MGNRNTGIQEYITLDKELQQHVQLEATLIDHISQQQSKLQALQAQQDQALTDKNSLGVELKQAEHQANELSLTDLHQQKTQLEKHKENLDAALGIAVKALEIKANLLDDQNELRQAENALLLANATKAQIQLAQVNKQSQLQEAQQAFDLMQAASQKSAEDLRALLKDQQPCPVCGAAEHPWADLLQPIKQPLSDQQARLNTLQAEKEQLIQDLSEQLGIIKQADKNQQLSSGRIGQAKITQSHLHEQWLLIALDNKTEWVDIQEAYVIGLGNQSDALKAEYAKLKRQEEDALQQQQLLKKMRFQFEQLNQLYIDKSVATAALDKKLAELCSNLSAKKESVQRVKHELKNLIEILSIPLQQIDHWQADLTQAGDAFLQQIRAAVSLWQEKAEQQTRVKEQCLQLEKALLGAESEQTLQSKLYLQYKQELDRHTQQQQVLLAERSQYFSGISATEYAANLDRTLHQTEAKKQESAAQIITANTDVETSKAAIGHWQKEQQRRAENHIIAQQNLTAALQAQQISKQTLESLLSKDESWIKTQTEKNQALAIALQEAQAALKISTQNISAHQSDAPEELEEHIREQIEQLTGEQDKLTQDKENNAFALRSDDEKIATGKVLQDQLQTQQQSWEQWESLNELIGSSSGQKFRVFAQSLTLETLLSYTNSHLQEFARRYMLQRVPGSDLELQVIDRDMADEVRSVHSLSGGESFLVSLALALGLASLSSNKTQVESLFIDEGFGSLDQETLDIAIASLDTLQSLGRKVGVISHVAVLVERIGAQIVVQKLGGGQSSVTIRAN
ncbi:SbcC/MukB-like Walker B domain-containing protein [Methyloprofundus sedimenti]|uniref:SbcC/MukB-like Walker B domain-containing protein n=1 Tax=Methyloprofundus sedimenti TaxID=1420851 RepID=UPI0018E9195C|nr:SbcC/MukB-like Walker B domain-containing protein [Methyloprofundus sedimenti]